MANVNFSYEYVNKLILKFKRSVTDTFNITMNYLVLLSFDKFKFVSDIH